MLPPISGPASLHAFTLKNNRYNFNSTTSYDNNAVSCSAYAYTNPQIGPVPLSNCSEPASKWFFNVTSDGFLLDVQRYVKQGK